MSSIKKMFNSIVNTEDDRLKIFRSVLVFAIAGALVITALFFNEHGRDTLTAYSLLVICILGMLFVATYYVEKPGTLYLIFFIIVSVIFFPLYFSHNNGIQKADQIWILMCFLMMFVFFDGFTMFIMWLLTVAANAYAYGTFIHAYGFSQVMLSYASLIFLGTMFGLIMKLQWGSISKARKTSEESRQEIEEASTSKSLYFANLSHELRTPVNSIIGMNEITLKENAADDILENSMGIQRAGNDLLKLINDILDWSKIESGNMEIVPIEYETSSMIMDLINVNFISANEKGLDFMIDIDENMPSRLYGDEVHIKQIINNILENAASYTFKGFISLTVGYEETEDENIRLKISVEDTGIGIKKDSINDIFSIFKRGSDGIREEGTGLGLSISKQLVEAMNGSITVDSIYKKGSVFTVSIPQKIIDKSPIGSLNFSIGRITGNNENSRQNYTAENANILVVDDNEMNLMITERLLKDTKMSVDFAKSGNECLQNTLKTKYDIILMDHMMPILNGEETLKLVRTQENGKNKETPVIALTANFTSNAREIYREKGFDGYLPKPINVNLLKASLLEFLPDELVTYEETDDTYEDEYVDTPTVFHNKKKRFAICATDVSDIPDEWKEKYDFKTIPSYIMTEEGRFMVNEELSTPDVLEYLEEGHTTQSLNPLTEDLERFFADRLTEAEQVLFFCMSSSLTDEVFSHAENIAGNYNNVTVIDSKNITTGMAFVMMEAARFAEDGATKDEILKALNNYSMKRISTSFVVDSVDFMYKNRFITKGLRDMSRLLNMHPILYMKNGKLTLKRFVFGTWEEIAEKYIREQLRHPKKIDDRRLVITYTGLSLEQISMIEKEVDKYLHFKEVKIKQTSATIAGVCGYGTFGLVFMRR